MCLDVCDLLPNTKTGQNLEYQLSKSSTLSALVYGKAQAAESKADFIHKNESCIKRNQGVENQPSNNNWKACDSWWKSSNSFKEANELMAIFLKSIETAKQNKIASTF